MAAKEYEFVDKVDHSLICPICQEVAMDPQQEVNCGKLFCKKCIEKIVDNKCPNCRTKKPKYFEDKRSYREIQDLKVKCTNIVNGCKWTGPLGAINDHVTKSCDFTLVTCKYEDIGCKERRTRKRIREHENDTSFHFSLSLDTVKKLKQDKNTLSPNGITIKMTNYTTRKNNNSHFLSDPFYSHPNGYKLLLCVWLNGETDHTKVGLQLLTGPYDANLSWPFEGTVTLQLLNQLENEEHFSVEIDLDRDDNWNPPKAKILMQFSFLRLLLSTWNKQYLKDDTLYFNIKIELKHYKPWLNASN